MTRWKRRNRTSSFKAKVALEALNATIGRDGKPDIFSTDQGSPFTSEEFTNVLKEAEINKSMDGKGRWMDNVFIERLWRSLKNKEVYLKDYESVKEARESIKIWMHFYNAERTHQVLDRQTPNEVNSACRILAE